MRLTDEFHAIAVTFNGLLGSMVMNLSLIVHPDFGATLVDASMPNSVSDVEAALAQDGISLGDIKQVIVPKMEVAFMATDCAEWRSLVPQLRAFARTLPEGASFEFDAAAVRIDDDSGTGSGL